MRIHSSASLSLSNRFQIQKILFFFAIYSLPFLCPTAYAQQVKLKLWDVEAIARSNSLSARLLDGQNGETVTTVSVETLRNLIDVKTKIAAAANQQAKLLIANGTEPNAFAFSQNGSPTIAVNLAMMKLLDEDYDAYAAVIGHEIAHLTLNHRDIRQQREGVRMVASNLLGLVLGQYGIPMGGAIATASTTAVSRSFSREDESAADKLGITYMREAGFDPQGAVRAWERLGAVAKSKGLSFFSTHPAPLDRLQEVKQLAAQGSKIAVAVNKNTIVTSMGDDGRPSSERIEKSIGKAQAIEQTSSKGEVESSQALTESKGSNIDTGCIGNKSRRLNLKSASVENAENVVAHDPSNAIAWYRLGAAHLDDKCIDKAIISFEEALKLNPKFSEAFFGLGAAYQNMGSHDRVEELYPKLRKIDPKMAKLYFKVYLLP